MSAHPPELLHFLGHYTHVGYQVLVLLSGILLFSLCFIALRKGKDHTIPEPKLTLRTLGELLVEGLDRFIVTVLGEEGRKYLPFFGSLFLFILIGNLMGLVPGLGSPTTNLNTNFGLAVIVFLMTHILGFKYHGIGYLKHFAGPVPWLSFLIFPIELLSHFVRPISLSVRLYGNMNGDHLVLFMFTGMTHLFIPVIFLFLGLFVSLIQATVFTMLSMIYIRMATEHEETHHSSS